MKPRRTPNPRWTAADRARHKAIRQEFAAHSTPDELHASGNYEGPIKGGGYCAVRILLHEPKKARQTAGLTLAAVSKRTGLDLATLSRLENSSPVPPRSFVDKSRGNIVQWSDMPRGGHFPMQEQPKLYMEYLRKIGRVFRSGGK